VPRVDFFYDLSCPYAYLGHTQIEALCTRARAELAWRPFLLGGLWNALGLPAAVAMSPAKARHNAIDMHRWASFFGVPLRMPATHPNRTVLALRAAIASGDVARASKALFRAYWVDALDVSRPEVVRAAIDGAGLDGAAAVLGAEAPAVKDELRRCTDEAVAAGVFGAPAFVVHTEGGAPQLFWGQDRLAFVEKACGGWRVDGPEGGS
jgi:2-hydroxychromene-2-carboxylate isomerase